MPWFRYEWSDRTMFYFYAIPAEPFLILAVVYVLGALVTAPATARLDGRIRSALRVSAADRRLYGTIFAGAFVLLVAVCFWWYYPLYVGSRSRTPTGCGTCCWAIGGSSRTPYRLTIRVSSPPSYSRCSRRPRPLMIRTIAVLPTGTTALTVLMPAPSAAATNRRARAVPMRWRCQPSSTSRASSG